MRISPGFVFGLALVVLLPTIARRDLWAPDEPRHAEVARTMLATSEWLVPHLNGAIYPDKPAPPFWLIAASMRVLGVHDWAARVPTVIAAAAILAMLVSIAAHLAIERVALLAVLVLATAFRTAWAFQRVSLDVMMTAFVCAAMLAWLRQWKGRGHPAANGAFFFGAIALGASIKGPLALLVPMFAALGHGFATRSLRRFSNPAFLGVGILTLLAVVGAWAIPVWLRTDAAYRYELFFKQSAGRIAQAWNHEAPPWYYLVDLPAEFMPWTPLLLVAIVAIARLRPTSSRDAWTFLVAWTLPAFVFLSIVESKRGNYLIPLFPGLALMTALGLDVLVHAGGAWLKSTRVAIAGGLTSILLAGLALAVGPFVPALHERGIDVPWVVAILGPLVAAATCSAGFAALRAGRLERATHVLGFGAVAAVVVVAVGVLPEIDAAKSARPIAQSLRDELPAGAYVPLLDVRAEEMRFYSGLDCRESDSKEDFAQALQDPHVRLAVAEAKALAKLRKKGLLPDSVVERPARAVGGTDAVVVLERVDGTRSRTGSSPK